VLDRNDEPSNATTDLGWPHRVALPAYRYMGHNSRTIHFFCEGLSLSPRTHGIHTGAADVVVFSFAERAHAEKFLDRFGGEFLAPATRRNDLSAERQLRYGRCINCDD
jgi:hypothetical protein